MFDIFYLENPSNLFAHEQKVDSVDQARQLSRTRYLWIVDGLNDYSDFDFLWEPVPWEADQIHVWPSQHQENSGTYLVPKYPSDQYNRTHNTVQRVFSVPRLHIKHTPTSQDAGELNTRYINDYLGTIRRSLSKTEWEYCWVTADVCDYSSFDFTWHPSEWQQDMLHVFASNEQKFGDTFYIHVPSFLEKTEKLKVLEWFETLHFVENISVPRIEYPKVQYTCDSLVEAVWNHEFTSPASLFYRNVNQLSAPAISYWQERTKTIVPLNQGNECVLVPREAKNYLKTQLYDYPWINKTHPKTSPSEYMDIVYISYDEPEAEKNWQHLQNFASNLPNRLTRIHGVQGMENALKAAAEESTTPWVYNVFAKTELDPSFKFNFVPDYMQSPKHYIFYCKNASNDLVYGHMAVIMYNCNMVKNAGSYEEQLGLDYTMSFPVEVVPEISCIGNFATSEYHAWRTAFRECAKLAYFNSVESDFENKHRLDVWTSYAKGAYADWVLRGANDGVEFFLESQGDLRYLQKSFRWEWLRERFNSKYGDLN